LILLLSDSEARNAISAIQGGIIRDDGMIEVDFPIFHPAGRSLIDPVPSLYFSPDSATVSLDGRSVRLPPIQFKLLRLLADRGRVPVEEAQDVAWGSEVSDHAIRCACSRLSMCLMESGIPYSVMYRRGYIVLEGDAS
jgi:hypothetical protein